MVRADLKSDPGNSFTHFDGRVLEHVHQLGDAWAKNLRKSWLLRTVRDRSKRHQGRITLLPVGVLDVGHDEGDDGWEYIVAQESAQLDEAAAASQVDTPFLFSVVLILDLDLADALEQQADQEIFVRGDEVEDLSLLLSARDLNLGNRGPEFDSL